MTVFHKMHGLGNAFAIVDSRIQTVDSALLLKAADWQTGIGFDQLVILENTDKADLRMVIYNADGSHVAMCGNASRCVAWLEQRNTGKSDMTIEAGDRVLRASVKDNDRVCVEMGAPGLDWNNIPLAEACDTLFIPGLPPELPQATAVSMGNPHCVMFFDDLAQIDTAFYGPLLETHPMFPERANIEFVRMMSEHECEVIVWERGTGFTQACGSGACAVAVAAIRRKRAETPITTHFPGGPLTLEWNAHPGSPVFMTGPASYVYEGKI